MSEFDIYLFFGGHYFRKDYTFKEQMFRAEINTCLCKTFHVILDSKIGGVAP